MPRGGLTRMNEEPQVIGCSGHRGLAVARNRAKVGVESGLGGRRAHPDAERPLQTIRLQPLSHVGRVQLPRRRQPSHEQLQHLPLRRLQRLSTERERGEVRVNPGWALKPTCRSVETLGELARARNAGGAWFLCDAEGRGNVSTPPSYNPDAKDTVLYAQQRTIAYRHCPGRMVTGARLHNRAHRH